VGGDNATQLRRAEHFRLVAVAQDPPRDLPQPGNGHAEIERAVVVEPEPLCLVPSDLGHVLRDQRAETDDDFLVRARLGDHLPGVAEIPLDGKAPRDLVAIVEQFEVANPSHVERPRAAVERRTADHVPAPAVEEQAVGVQPGGDFVFDGAAVADPYAAELGDGLQQLVVKRLLPVERIARRHPHRDGLAGCPQPLAEPIGEVAGQLQGGTSGRLEKGELRGTDRRLVLPQVVTEDDQGQHLFGGEVRRREKIGAGNVIALLLIVVDQRHPRLAQSVQVAKDGPPADLAGLGQRLSVVPPSTLKHSDQLQESADSRQIHVRRPIASCFSTRPRHDPLDGSRFPHRLLDTLPA